MMPGPAWYASPSSTTTLHIPAGEITAAPPAAVGQRDARDDRSGRRRPVDHLQALQELDGRADFVIWATTVFNPTGKDARAGYPAYEPLADTVACGTRPPTRTSRPIRHRRSERRPARSGRAGTW